MTTQKGRTYTFVVDHLQTLISPGNQVLETGCGRAQYRQIVEGFSGIYLGCDVPNDHYQNRRALDVFSSSDALPFADESVNLVFNQGAIDYMPNIKKTLDEVNRVLEPDGRFIIYTYRYDVLLEIHQNCMKSGRHWEIHHHVFTPRQMLDYLENAEFQAKDISKNLQSWEPYRWLNFITKAIGLYSALNIKRSRWRVFEAVKANASA